MRRCVGLIVGILALIGGISDSGWASETFVCADGRLLSVTSANRTQMYEDPCVKEWFAANPPRQAGLLDVDDDESVVTNFPDQRVGNVQMFRRIIGAKPNSLITERMNIVRSHTRANGAAVRGRIRSPSGAISHRQ